jgi:hypothetical protein
MTGILDIRQRRGGRKERKHKVDPAGNRPRGEGAQRGTMLGQRESLLNRGPICTTQARGRFGVRGGRDDRKQESQVKGEAVEWRA